MNSVLSFLKKIPLWLWVIFALAILFFINQISAWTTNRSLFNLALDQIRTDQTQIVQDQGVWINTCEQEIQDLQRKIETNKKQQVTLRAENDKLKGRIKDLENALPNIVVPSDPDALVDSLRKHGIGSAHRRKR